MIVNVHGLFYLVWDKFATISEGYDEKIVADYMKNENIDLTVEISTGTKSFTVFSMDLTKKYIEINADYRS